MSYGYFIDNGNKFKITERDLPRNWYNYMWNNDYIAFVSQVGKGNGFGQDELGKRVCLVNSRKIYISDSEEFWSADGLPVDKDLEGYECIHSLGATTITSRYKNIETDFTLFVPRTGFCELWIVKVKK